MNHDSFHAYTMSQISKCLLQSIYLGFKVRKEKKNPYKRHTTTVINGKHCFISKNVHGLRGEVSKTKICSHGIWNLLPPNVKKYKRPSKMDNLGTAVLI